MLINSALFFLSLLGFSLCSMERPMPRSALYNAVKAKNIPRIKELLALPYKKELLEYGPSDKYYSTPLLSAVASGNIEIVRLLVAAGANILGVNRVGGTPINYILGIPHGEKMLIAMIEETSDIKQLRLAGKFLFKGPYPHLHPENGRHRLILRHLLMKIGILIVDFPSSSSLFNESDAIIGPQRRGYLQEIVPFFFESKMRQRRELLDSFKDSTAYASILPLELRTMALDYVYGSQEPKKAV